MKTLFTNLTLAFVALNSTTTYAEPVQELIYALASQAYTNARIVGVSAQNQIIEGTLLVKMGKVEKIQPTSVPIPSEYQVIDLQHKWVMPGIIDAHVHLAQSASAFTRPDMINATKIQSFAQDQKWLTDNRHHLLANYLKVGITSIFDLGGPSINLTDYAQLMATRKSPDIFAAAELISTTAEPALEEKGKTFLSVNSADEAKASVEKQLALPIHTVKFVWTSEANKSPQELFDLYFEAMNTAKRAGKVVAVHIEDLEYAKMAIKAGADILVHGVMTSLIDEEFIALAKQYRVTYMPTLSAYQHYIDIFKQKVTFTDLEHALGNEAVIRSFSALKARRKDTDQMFQMITQYLPYVDNVHAQAQLSEQEKGVISQLSQMFSSEQVSIQQRNLIQVIQANIAVAIGTDAGNPATLHGLAMLGEAQAWLNAGVPIQKIISTMTLGNAKAYGVENRIGTLNSGKDASFVVYEANPMSSQFPTMLPQMVVLRGNLVELETKGE
jgi:imidazolonepropionase-like amidohydrolase